jgi:uncharacterized membrane protein
MVPYSPQPLVPWRRSLAKTLTWRVVAMIDTFVISYVITGSALWAGSIVSIEVFTKLLFYYLHERAWAHLKWGLRPGGSAGPVPSQT